MQKDFPKVSVSGLPSKESNLIMSLCTCLKDTALAVSVPNNWKVKLSAYLPSYLRTYKETVLLDNFSNDLSHTSLQGEALPVV